jgi:hypothetical protein
MSDNSIIEKLNRHIAQGLRKESDVTYVLVQLGKFIERANAERNYPVLTFYRNWAVHEKLDRVKANPEMKVILDRFEAVVQASQSGADMQTVINQVTDSISLRKLGTEIDLVFDSDPRFDRGRVGQPEQWPDFGTLLLSILADISLEAGKAYADIQELKIDDNGRFDTLVITPRQGQSIPVPLAR